MSLGFLMNSWSDAVITVFARSALVSRSRNCAIDFRVLDDLNPTSSAGSPYLAVLAAELAAMNGAEAALLPASAASAEPSP